MFNLKTAVKADGDGADAQKPKRFGQMRRFQTCNCRF
jgi:hypothetical protein